VIPFSIADLLLRPLPYPRASSPQRSKTVHLVLSIGHSSLDGNLLVSTHLYYYYNHSTSPPASPSTAPASGTTDSRFNTNPLNIAHSGIALTLVSVSPPIPESPLAHPVRPSSHSRVDRSTQTHSASGTALGRGAYLNLPAWTDYPLPYERIRLESKRRAYIHQYARPPDPQRFSIQALP